MENQIQSRFNQFQENNYHDDGNNQHGYNNDDDDEQVSDCESVISNNSDYYDELFGDDDDLVKLEKEDPIHNAIHDKFVSCLGDVGNNKASVVAIHKKVWSNSHEGDWRRRCFEVYRQGLKNKYGDENNMKFVWYGSSKEDIARIMSRGFGINDIPNNNGAFGDGINFFPIKFLTQSLNSCVIQDDGLMHVMLCRVLLEREDIVSDSNPLKSQLSSDNPKNDDDDEDEVVSPTTYVIRSTKMNTHILPEYVISFKTPLSTTPSLKSTLISSPLIDSSKQRPTLKRPISPWMTFSTLILALAKLLPPRKINLIIKLHKNLKDRKISRLDFIEHLKRLVGVNLLVVVVKLCGEKEGSFFKGHEQLRSMKRAMGKSGCRGPKICKSNKINVACARS